MAVPLIVPAPCPHRYVLAYGTPSNSEYQLNAHPISIPPSFWLSTSSGPPQGPGLQMVPGNHLRIPVAGCIAWNIAWQLPAVQSECTCTLMNGHNREGTKHHWVSIWREDTTGRAKSMLCGWLFPDLGTDSVSTGPLPGSQMSATCEQGQGCGSSQSSQILPSKRKAILQLSCCTSSAVVLP